MNDAKIVLVDCDGVLADFLTSAIQVLNTEYGYRLDPKDYKTWDMVDSYPVSKKLMNDITAREGFCSSLRPYPGAVEGINSLRLLGHDVYCLTHPSPGKYWMYEREMWLVQHFGFERGNIIQGAKKTLVWGHALIDDRESTILAWANGWLNSHAILWDAVHNRSAVLPDNASRATSWLDIPDLLKKEV